jgi:glycosyltransferase involved in cell wall biosynthesis
MSKPKVIMQILPSLENGGVERGVVDITKELKKQGFAPIVLSKGGMMTYQLREAKIEHITLDVKTKNPIKIFRNINKIAKIIEENKVDLVHARSRAPMISAYFACKKTNVKLISTVHGSYSINLYKWKNFPLKRMYNAVMLKADYVIAVSHFIKNYIIENYQPFEKTNLLDKLQVVARGADLKYFSAESISINRAIDLSQKWSLPEDKKIILFPARITAWKGHEFLIEALKKIKSDAVCIFVGSDHGHKKFRKKLEQKIIAENLAGKIKFVGVCKEMPVAYSLANLVISASVKPEAFGRVAIEAQAMKKIVIATNIGGSLETIIDKKTGFLVENKNSDMLASLIDEVLSMPKEKSDEICANARKNVEDNFSNQKMCDEMVKIYKKFV